MKSLRFGKANFPIEFKSVIRGSCISIKDVAIICGLSNRRMNNLISNSSRMDDKEFKVISKFVKAAKDEEWLKQVTSANNARIEMLAKWINNYNASTTSVA